MNHVRHHNRRGIIITDAVIGLSIVASLLAITAITVGHDLRATRAAAEHRQLTVEAEAVLLALQIGEALPAREDAKIAITLTPLQDEDAPAGYVWGIAEATGNGQKVAVTGLVPINAARSLSEPDTPSRVAPAGNGGAL